MDLGLLQLRALTMRRVYNHPPGAVNFDGQRVGLLRTMSKQPPQHFNDILVSVVLVIKQHDMVWG